LALSIDGVLFRFSTFWWIWDVCFWHNPYRRDGMNLIHEIAGQFVGNIYETGSCDLAKAKADTLAAKLNSVGFPPILSHAIH
jgi:hypothetical protein